jgi:long-chain fatty acid transport protein
MPALASIGIANTSIPNLTLEFDLQWTGWSSVDTLILDFENPAVPDFTAPKNWNDVIALRFGGEYRLNDAMALRLGYVYDPTPVPGETLDTLVPDADRHDFSIGFGAKFEKLTVDVAYMAIVFKDRKVDNIQNTDIPGLQYRLHGTFETLAHLFGLSVSYHF